MKAPFLTHGYDCAEIVAMAFITLYGKYRIDLGKILARYNTEYTEIKNMCYNVHYN